MISISARRMIQTLAWMILGFGLANVFVQLCKYVLDRGGLWGVSRLFDVDVENNIPSWYSSITLLICAILLGLIATTKRQSGDRYANHWLGLSIMFLILSIDEAASIHELLIPLGDKVGASGIFHFFWVVPGVILVTLIGLFYRKFLLDLPTSTRNHVLVAAMFYLGGAIGLEMIIGLTVSSFPTVEFWDSSSGWMGISVALLTTLEEMFEMIGVAVMIYALLSYIRFSVKDIKVIFR